MQTKHSESIHLKTSFAFQIGKNENNHHCINTSKDFLSHIHRQSPTILRHISTPSLELSHYNQINSLKFTRSSFGRNHVRKTQPRTNPNYVNIQIKTNEGSLRSKYIRINDVQKCSTLTFSSSSNSSSEQESILCNSQANIYFPSDETISSNKTNSEQQNESIINQKSSSSSKCNGDQTNNTHTLTNKTDLMTKQFIACTDGKSILYCVNPKRNKNVFFLEFLFHSTTDPLTLNFQQIKTINNGKCLDDFTHF